MEPIGWYPVKKAKEEKANASHGQGIGFSLLTRIRVAPTDIIGFIPTDFYSRVWVRVRVSSCGFFRFGFLFVDSDVSFDYSNFNLTHLAVSNISRPNNFVNH